MKNLKTFYFYEFFFKLCKKKIRILFKEDFFLEFFLHILQFRTKSP